MSTPPPRNVRDVIAEYLRQVDEGIPTSQDEVLARHPRIADELRREFRKLNALSDAVGKAGSAPNEPPAPSSDSRLLIRCPHCNKPVDADVNETSRLFACGSCDNEFSLVRERKWPTQINHFELVERIGMGGFGTVWKARDVELDRLVALKLPRHTHPDGKEAELFMQEARTAANLNHPNIVRVFEVGAFDGEVYIASELIDGDSLSNRIGHGLTEPETLVLAEQLARALAYAHSEGVIHRDLKPQNVIVDGSGKPYLSDFGLAGPAVTDVSLTITGQVLGTPNYMSPEQARGDSVDERSDIYSFGVLLYETLTGQVPFQGTLPNVLRRLESEDPIGPKKINDRLSRDIDTICMKCLEKNREYRYQSADEVVSELQHAINGKPIQARPVGPLNQLSRWAKRNPTIATLSGIAILAFLSVGYLLNSLSAQRKISAVESRHTTLARMKEIRAEAKAGYRTRISDLVRDSPEMIEDGTFHDPVRDIAIRSMGDFAGYTPLQLSLQDASTAAINFDGSLLAIAYDKSPRIEVRRTSSLDKVLHSFVTEVSHDHPITLRFPSESNNQLVWLSQQGILSRSEWSTGQVDTKVVARLRQFPVDKEGKPTNRVTAGAISLDGSRVALCDDMATVSIFDTNRSELIFSEHVDTLGDAQLQNVAISEDQNHLAAGYSDAGGSVGGLIRWNLSDDNSLLNVPLNMGRQYENGLAFTRDGKHIGVGCEQTTHYEVKSMEIRQSFEGSESAALAFSPNGAYLAVCYISGEIEIRHRKSKAAIALLAYENNAGRSGAAFSAQGNHLIVWNKTGLQIVNLAASRERLELAGHRRGIPAIRFADRGDTLLSSGKNGFVRRWNSHTGKLISEKKLGSQVQCVVLDPQEKRMITASWGKEAKLSIWNYPTLTHVRNIPNDLGNICGLAFSPNGKFIAATGDYGLSLWEVTATEGDLKLEPVFSQTVDTESGEKSNGKFLTFSPNEERVFHATQWWNLHWLELSTLESHAFAEGRSLLMGFNSMAFTKERNLAFINPNGGLETWKFSSDAKPKREMKLPDDTFAVSTVTINRQGLLAGLTDGRTVSIWDLDREKELYKFRPEANAVWALAWSPDGNRLAVGLSDGGLAIWDLREIRKQLNELEFQE